MHHVVCSLNVLCLCTIIGICKVQTRTGIVVQRRRCVGHMSAQCFYLAAQYPTIAMRTYAFKLHMSTQTASLILQNCANGLPMDGLTFCVRACVTASVGLLPCASCTAAAKGVWYPSPCACNSMLSAHSSRLPLPTLSYGTQIKTHTALVPTYLAALNEAYMV